MARNLTAEPPLPVNEIQGDILIGLPKRHEHLMFFEIVDPVKFKAFLKTVDITSVQECLEKRQAIADNKAKGGANTYPDTRAQYRIHVQRSRKTWCRRTQRGVSCIYKWDGSESGKAE